MTGEKLYSMGDYEKYTVNELTAVIDYLKNQDKEDFYNEWQHEFIRQEINQIQGMLKSRK